MVRSRLCCFCSRHRKPALAESAEESLNRKRAHEQAQLQRDAKPRKKAVKIKPPELRTNDLAATGINPLPGQIARLKEGEQAQVVGREQEVADIFDFCKERVTGRQVHRNGVLERFHGGTLYISGAPGVGKTLTIHTVQRLLASWHGAKVQHPKIVNINAMQIQDPEHVFVLVHQALYPAAPKPDRANARNLLSKRLRRSWLEDSFTTFLFIDEIDGLLTGSNTSVLYTLFEWPFQPGSRLVVVGVANSIDLTDRTLPYLKQKRCEPKTVHFQTYNQEQLKRIVQHMQQKVKTSQASHSVCGMEGDQSTGEEWQRAGEKQWRVGLARVTLTPEAIELCARKVSAVSGDARKLLALCSSAARIAVRAAGQSTSTAAPGDNCIPVNIKHVVDASNEIFGGKVESILKTLTTQQQLTVCAFVLLQRKGFQGNLTLAKLYSTFHELCRSRKLEQFLVDKSEFMNLCENALVNQRIIAISDGGGRGRGRSKLQSGLVSKKPKGMRRSGSGGDGRTVTLQVKEDQIMTALGTKPILARILEVNE